MCCLAFMSRVPLPPHTYIRSFQVKMHHGWCLGVHVVHAPRNVQSALDAVLPAKLNFFFFVQQLVEVPVNAQLHHHRKRIKRDREEANQIRRVEVTGKIKNFGSKMDFVPHDENFFSEFVKRVTKVSVVGLSCEDLQRHGISFKLR